METESNFVFEKSKNPLSVSRFQFCPSRDALRRTHIYNRVCVCVSRDTTAQSVFESAKTESAQHVGAKTAKTESAGRPAGRQTAKLKVENRYAIKLKVPKLKVKVKRSM